MNGLSKRGPALVLVLEELELILEELLTLEELTIEETELDLTLEETTEDTELDLTLEDTTEEIELEERLLEETGQLAPPTTPKGAGWVAQVDWAIQLLPFS